LDVIAALAPMVVTCQIETVTLLNEFPTIVNWLGYIEDLLRMKSLVENLLRVVVYYIYCMRMSGSIKVTDCHK
jgi:hypothetical protein